LSNIFIIIFIVLSNIIFLFWFYDFLGILG
jgi:hypothetical protein